MQAIIHRPSQQEMLALLETADPEQEWVLDTETDGLEVIGHAAKHSAWWIGLMPLGTPNVFIISIEEYNDWGLESAFKGMHFIGHNLRFDLHALNLPSAYNGHWRDTMIAAYFAHTSGRHSMDHIAKVNGWENIETPYLLKQGRIGEMPKQQLFQYLANDCLITACMAMRFQMDAANFDYQVDAAVYAMERRGIRLLVDQFHIVKHELAEMIEERTLALRDNGMAGNLDSPFQIAEWLLAKGRRLPYSESGRPSTSKLALQKLADEGDTLADMVLNYRKAVKLKTAFIDPLPKLAQDGILYPRTNITRTKTGRFSCDSPNLQQIPKRGPLGKALRGCMTSRDHSGVVACDFSQVELRVAAAFANEPVLLEAFASGRCPHTEVAAKMVGKRPEDITPDERFKAKAVNFGILNGMGAKRLAFELKTDKATANRFLMDYKRNLSSLHHWMEGVWREAEAFRLARTIAGRTRIFSSTEDIRSAVSVLVQGSAAEIMRHALVAVHERCLEPILSVHDEILIPGSGQIDSRAEELREVMEEAADNAYPDAFSSVKFQASSSIGGTWGDV